MAFPLRPLLLILLFLQVSFAFSQLITVKHSETLAPLEGVSITGMQSRVQVTTNLRGEAPLTGFVKDEVLFVLKPGFETIQSTWPGEGNLLIHLPEKIYSLDAVVVSASRFEEVRADVPQQIQVLGSRQIQFANQPNMAELLQNTGNVMVQKSQGGGGSPVLRGFEANKVLLVVDGVRMNNAIYRGGHLQNVLTLDNSVLERAEIVFGPGSVIYGSDALGGVMHFYTRTPVFGDEDKNLVKTGLMSRYSSAFDEKTAHFDVNIGFRKVALLTSATVSDFGDLRQGNVRSPYNPGFGRRDFVVRPYLAVDSAFVNPDYNVQVGSAYRQYDFLQKVRVAGKRSDHTLNFQYSTSSDIPRYDRLVLTRSNGQPRFGEWYYGPQKRLMLSYQLQLEQALWYDRARITAAYQDIEESRHDRTFRSPILNNRVENVSVWSLTADFEKEIGRNELRFGLDGNTNDVRSTAFTRNSQTAEKGPLDTRYASGGAQMQSFAAYITETIELNEKLILNAGARLSYVGLQALFSDTTFFKFPFSETEQKNTALNGSAGVVWKPSASWRLAAVLSTGFRAPNVDDLSKVFESVPGNVIVPNPDMGPEKTKNAELSVSRIFGKIQAEATGWYTWYTDALTTRPALYKGQDSIMYAGQLSRVVMPVNAQSAYMYGFNLQLRSEIGTVLISSSINYTFGRIRTDSTDYPLDHIPPVFGQTSFMTWLKRFQLEFFVRYSGWKRLEDYNEVGEDNLSQATPVGMPAWYTLNLRSSVALNRTFRVQASLENILDQNYRVFASGISAPGRNFILSLRASF